MATTAQILANRKNSAHSTGPVTDEGKFIAKRNAFKHGLAASNMMLEGEDVEAFKVLEDALLEEHAPVTPTEMLLVRDMAKFHWLMDRAVYLQVQAMNTIAKFHIEPAIGLNLLIRYQTTNDRAFHKALATLTKLRKDRPIAEIGSVPREPAGPIAIAANQAAVTGFEDFLRDIVRPRTSAEPIEAADLDVFADGGPLNRVA